LPVRGSTGAANDVGVISNISDNGSSRVKDFYNCVERF